jgi:phosphatidylglycerophosphate synthase
MREHLRTLPNQLTVLRLALVPLLWTAAAFGLGAVVAVGLALAAATDALDGYLARRLGQVSAFGSRLDAVADTLTLVSAVGWTLMLRPEVGANHPVLLPLAAGLALLSLAVGWVRFRRIADLHLYSARAAAIVGYPFVVHALLGDGYLKPLFYLTAWLAVLASVEALAVQLTRASADRPVGSLVRLSSPSRE